METTLIGIHWDEWTPHVEARLAQDFMRILSILKTEQVVPEVFLASELESSERTMASTLLKRLGVSVTTAAETAPSYVAVYFAKTCPELPEVYDGVPVYEVCLEPDPHYKTMQKPDHDPLPRENMYQTVIQEPRFRTQIPQGTPTIYALPWWAWNNGILP